MNFFIILFLNIDNTHNFDRIIWCHHPVDQCCNAYAASSLFRAQFLFSRFDSDKSGYISFSEFAVAGPSSHDVEEEAAVLQPQWDALSQVRFVHVALSQPDSNVLLHFRHCHLYEGFMAARPPFRANQPSTVKDQQTLTPLLAGADFRAGPNERYFADFL